MRHYLVVADQTLSQPPPVRTIEECGADGHCDFSSLLPATPAHARFTPAAATALARHRLPPTVRSAPLEVHT